MLTLNSARQTNHTAYTQKMISNETRENVLLPFTKFPIFHCLQFHSLSYNVIAYGVDISCSAIFVELFVRFFRHTFNVYWHELNDHSFNYVYLILNDFSSCFILTQSLLYLLVGMKMEAYSDSNHLEGMVH